MVLGQDKCVLRSHIVIHEHLTSEKDMQTPRKLTLTQQKILAHLACAVSKIECSAAQIKKSAP
jgi:hypothetical protein